MTRQVKIDAKGENLGRLASRISMILMGKDRASFAPNKVEDVEVEVENASKMNISSKKLEQETHERYSGYPGGRKVLTWKEVIEKKGYSALLIEAVKGMLPKNKLQKERLKRLKIKD